MTNEEIVIRTLAAVARGLRDSDDIVLLLIRFADVFDDKSVSPDEAFARLESLFEALPVVRALADRNEDEQH